MPVYNLTCPECRATLRTGKPIVAGTVLDCPKCGVMFPAPKATAREEAVAAVEVDDAPPLRQARNRISDHMRPRRKFRPKRKSSNQGLVIGIGVAAVVLVLLAGLGILGYKLLSGGKKGNSRPDVQWAAEGRPVVGQQAPDILGEDLDGKPFKLSDYAGKVILLDFWAHW